MSIEEFTQQWSKAIRSVDDLVTIDLEVDEMKKPIKAVYTHGWKIVDGDGVVMAEDAVHDYTQGDVPPEMVTLVEKLFAVDIPGRFWEVSAAWGDEALDAIEDAGGDEEKARQALRKKHREARSRR